MYRMTQGKMLYEKNGKKIKCRIRVSISSTNVGFAATDQVIFDALVTSIAY